jgi:CRISPR-associated protein Csb1
MASTLDFESVREAVTGTGAAFRCRTRLQPAGGPGDKIFPATYEGGICAEETRLIPGEGQVPCVLIDSVASQANRMELALLEAQRKGEISLPVITVDFTQLDPPLPEPLKVTSLEAPHRIADAILRDSLLDGKPFRHDSRYAEMLDQADSGNATALFELCPTALLFGVWDSTGPKGGLGTKIQRAVVSEIVGVNAIRGKRTSSRIDPLGIQKVPGAVLYQSADQSGWTLDKESARQKGNKAVTIGKDGKPSNVNHGNVTPTQSDGSYTCAYALLTTVISLPALRRLRFPLNGGVSRQQDNAARVVLTSMGLAAATLAFADGFDLRSRCALFPEEPLQWELLDAPGSSPRRFCLDRDGAIQLLQQSVDQAVGHGLPWLEQGLTLLPANNLAQLVRLSQDQGDE